ncbi:hypothetical protein GKG47_18670 [Lactonifactor sp. BIOML-A3]|uniref:hypothetical protein n=1 Tax=Lactonifactor TaxID=420345 RepID=UPI0012AF221F|nr:MULTISPECIES: hypothetical protein [Lactonifactor]MSA14448.1 hypothetical protein [Lactonifactor sp. BIOML-A3]MSA18851.1 hypothetical protein [Lactonifactor sp. BIOML-A2]MSA39636.1 hypothetical protein [Lactonifactor sp. BIOML-A1]MCB5712972.1 hypothetical protein [Lactonifactor longoviformis]MCB5717188.1 hypothetical protein [Lactonifactor longoviformis]
MRRNYLINCGIPLEIKAKSCLESIGTARRAFGFWFIGNPKAWNATQRQYNPIMGDAMIDRE